MLAAGITGWTLDTVGDYALVKRVLKELYPSSPARAIGNVVASSTRIPTCAL